MNKLFLLFPVYAFFIVINSAFFILVRESLISTCCFAILALQYNLEVKDFCMLTF